MRHVIAYIDDDALTLGCRTVLVRTEVRSANPGTYQPRDTFVFEGLASGSLAGPQFGDERLDLRAQTLAPAVRNVQTRVRENVAELFGAFEVRRDQGAVDHRGVVRSEQAGTTVVSICSFVLIRSTAGFSGRWGSQVMDTMSGICHTEDNEAVTSTQGERSMTARGFPRRPSPPMRPSSPARAISSSQRTRAIAKFPPAESPSTTILSAGMPNPPSDSGETR